MSLLPESVVPGNLRASIRAQLAAIPHAKANEQADLIADLTVHAVKEAIAAIDRVASRGPNLGVRMAVLSGAVSSTKSLLDNVEQALRSYAVEVGGQIWSGTTDITGEAK
jgi:hypothetical protein